MVYRNYTSDSFKEATKKAEMVLIRAMLIGILAVISGVALYVFISSVFILFFAAIGMSFGTIYFIQNYRGWRVVQDVKRKGRFDDEDKERMRRI